MKKKVLFTVLTASLMCAAAAVTFAACGETKTYSVTYAKYSTETGSVPTDTNKYEKGKEVTVKGKNDLDLDGQTFEGWTYDGTTYTEGQKIKMPGKDITLTASWSPIPSCTITYVLGEGGSWTYPDEAPETSVAKDTEITLPGLYDVKKDGQEVTGWTIGEETLDPGASYTVTGDVTITAVWGTQKHAVSYVGNRLQGQVENGGRHEADTKITVIGVPEEWKSETKVFQGWEYTIPAEEGDEDAVKNENDEWVITTIYQPDDEFTVPAGGATLTAKWNYVGVYVNFILDRDDFETEPVQVLYKPGQEAAFAAAVPALPTNAPEGTEYHWIYENSYMEDEASYVEYIVCDMGAQTLALLSSAITAGIEEVEVYAECSKIVSSLTLNAWNTVAESLPIQYGQTVTVTADIKMTGTAEYMGVFGYLAKADDAAVNTKLRWDWWFADADSNGADQTKCEALKVSTAKEVVIQKDGAPVANTIELLTSLFPNISNFQIVADYTTEGTIVITVSFSSYTVETVEEDEVTHYYSYTGTATYTVLDPHAGLAQSYLFGIGGQGATVKNVKFIVEGDVETITPPVAECDYTEANGYKCTICGAINPEHPHNFVEEVCTICGAIDTVNHTRHRYGEDGGFCTVCGNAYQITIDGTTYTADLTSTEIENNDAGTAWWSDGKTSNIEIGEGNQIAVISWEKERDPDYYDVRIDITGEEGKDASDPWTVGGVFRLGPNGWVPEQNAAPDVYEGIFTKGEQVVTVGTLPVDHTANASLGSYKAVVVKIGDKMIVSLQCYRDGSLFWSRTVTVDLTNTNLPEGTLYFRIAGNPYFCDDFTAATGTFTAVE